MHLQIQAAVGKRDLLLLVMDNRRDEGFRLDGWLGIRVGSTARAFPLARDGGELIWRAQRHQGPQAHQDRSLSPGYKWM